MSIEGFVAGLRHRLKDLHSARTSAYGSQKGALTREINELEKAIKMAEREKLDK